MNISGRVQGVGFRYFVKKHANTLGVKGVVQNTENGLVQVIAEGEEDVLKHLLKLCKEGSSFSKVTKIDSNWSDSLGEFNTFEIKS